MTWGLAGGSALGFGFGRLVGNIINRVIAAEERRLIRRIESAALHLFEGEDA